MLDRNGLDRYRVTNKDQIPSPALLFYPEVIEQNLQTMIGWAGNAETLRPHVKTHKLPQIIQMKLRAGIRRFKTSTIAEAEMTAAAGGRDVLLAYPCVGPNIDRLIQLSKAFPGTHFSTLVDHVDVARRISAQAIECDTQVHVYLDLNIGMNRTGISPGDEAFELHLQISRMPGIEVDGLHAYDGHLHDNDAEFIAKQAELAFAPVWKLADRITDTGLPTPKIIGCGTPTSKLMAERYPIEVSAGTSVLWDAGQPTFTPDIQIKNAALLLCRVVSRPTPNSICIDLGTKAVASEMPVPRAVFPEIDDARWMMHSEEHAVIETRKAESLEVGSCLYAIPWHICPTVALHDRVWCVRDGKAIETWSVTARSRKLRF